MAIAEPSNASSASGSSSAAAIILAYAITIFLSAFLLFQVQPLISKFILPWFGGSPAVWTTCMLFFQLVLFGGYAYAHVLAAWLGSRGQLGVHVVLLLAAAVFLPIVPNETWKPLGDESPTLRILLLLLATVGLPYFALSATGPLLQSWFSDAFVGKSPYRLFALSNLGSLLALLSYPFLFEIYWNSHEQAWYWSGGFLVFAVCCAFCAIWTFVARSRRGMDEPATMAAADRSTARGSTSLARYALWIFLPAMASLMLLAVTNYVCQDVAVVPLLWIVPLSLYLLSFIVAFDHPRWYSRAWCAPLTAVVLFLAAGMYDLPDLLPTALQFDVSFVQELVLYFGALFLVCLLCHGELARLRPPARQLTAYYLSISAGGALGGIFVSLVAPRIFTTFYEWPLGLVGCFLLATILTIFALQQRLKDSRGLAAGSAATLAAAALYGAYWMHDWQSPGGNNTYNARNFYGTVSVLQFDRDDPLEHVYQFRSGSIKHGMQYAHPDKRHIPTAYYGGDSGCARAMKYVSKKPGARIGVVGLGVGTIATYAQPGQYVRFYEINPEVEKIARTHFTYLSDCQAKCEVALGDARLCLEREEPNRFDVLVLDAFSGDSIPVHLLTDEAFRIYKRHLNADGLLVVHITNSFLTLFPVVERLAQEHGFAYTRLYRNADPDRLLNRNDYMILTNDRDFLAANPPEPPKEPERKIDIPLWTDQYSNLFMLLKH